LGAGKTTLVRAIAIALGVEPRLIASPTFALVHEYPGRWPVYHFDAYRLSSVAEFVGLGVDEYFHGDGVCLIEWADRVAACLPAEHLWITIGVTGEMTRRLEITARGERYIKLVESLPTPAS